MAKSLKPLALLVFLMLSVTLVFLHVRLKEQRRLYASLSDAYVLSTRMQQESSGLLRDAHAAELAGYAEIAALRLQVAALQQSAGAQAARYARLRDDCTPRQVPVFERTGSLR